jgi:hypothetical protein
MIVLVCGGRTFADGRRLWRALDQIHALEPITLIVHDCSLGASQFAMAWAIERNVPHPAAKYAAAWKARMGKPAGPTRNMKMLRDHKVDLVLAFPRGDGFWAKGTKDMIKQATAAGIRVIRPPPQRTTQPA